MCWQIRKQVGRQRSEEKEIEKNGKREKRLHLRLKLEA